MIALEKLLLLKSVKFFQQTPDDLLMQVVTTAVEEQIVSAGELIIKKDDTDTTMYVIAKGRVKVHDGDILIAELGEREIFGELSALSFEKRVASVSALTECVLLKISSAVLYDMMSFDIGFAQGIIKALCARTRLISTQMQELLYSTKNKPNNA